MANPRITGNPLKVLLRSAKRKLRSLYIWVLVPTKRQEIPVESIQRPSITQADSAYSVFRRGKLDVIIYRADKTKVSVLPVTNNPRRRVLYSEAGRRGLRVFYYSDNVDHVYIACHEAFIRLHRDQLYQVHKALRKFTKNAKPTQFTKPGKPFTEYKEPWGSPET